MDNRKMNYDPVRRWGCVSVILGYVIAAALVLLFASCTRTVYTPVESVRTEYRDRDVERVVTDTVRDTRVVWIKGDTVVDVRDRWHKSLEYVHDTCYVERTDSIQVPYPVERKLTRWQQAKQDVGGMAIGGVAIAVLVGFVALTGKIKKWKTKN